jgi:hypothetical protein
MFNESYSSGGAGTSSFGTGTIVLIAFTVLFVAALIWAVIGKAFPSLPNPIPYITPTSMVTYARSKRVWPPSGNTTNLIARSSQIGLLQDSVYTFNMEIVLKNVATTDASGLHRHIFHRGSDDYTGTPPPSSTNALPKRMNPGVFQDPLTNDLLIFVDTLEGSGTGYRESLRIPDLPLMVPFRLGLVLNNRTLDVYLNCRLEETKFLQGTPRTVENVLYGLTGPSIAPAQLQNVYVWTESLPAKEMTTLCGTKPVIATTPTCGGALPTAPDVDAEREAATAAATLGAGPVVPSFSSALNAGRISLLTMANNALGIQTNLSAS